MLDDIFHRIAQAAGSVHRDYYQRCVAAFGVGKAFVDVRGENGFDFAIQLEIENRGGRLLFCGCGGKGENQRRDAKDTECRGEREKTGRRMSPTGNKPKIAS